MTLSSQQMIKKLFLSGCKEGLEPLRDLAVGMCSQRCLDKIQVNRVVLALDELFANIHEHGYTNNGGDIQCSARWVKIVEGYCHLELVLRDFARVIPDFRNCHGVCVETLKENPVAGGLGIHLIEAATDQFEHTPLEDGNKWRLLFKLHEENKG